MIEEEPVSSPDEQAAEDLERMLRETGGEPSGQRFNREELYEEMLKERRLV